MNKDDNAVDYWMYVPKIIDFKIDNRMTIEEKLEKYKERNLSFYEAYSDCKPIEEIEGQILEDATYGGYAITDKYGNRYFTDYGIRGWEKGTFRITDGAPVRVIKRPDDRVLRHVAKIISSSNSQINEFTLFRLLGGVWYDMQ